jgi:ribosomal 50S subunit-recycling heat shock protein
MRLDLFLKVSRLVPRRGAAADLCRDEKVIVNGRPAKASRAVAPGDRLTITLPGRELTVQVTALPSRKNIPKAEATTLYTLLSENRFDFWGRPVEKKD